jgi:hypothetical protein
VVLWSLKQYSSIPPNLYSGISTLWTQNESSELLGFWILSIDWKPEYYKRRKGDAWKPSEPENFYEHFSHVSKIINRMYFATTSVFSSVIPSILFSHAWNVYTWSNIETRKRT